MGEFDAPMQRLDGVAVFARTHQQIQRADLVFDEAEPLEGRQDLRRQAQRLLAIAALVGERRAVPEHAGDPHLVVDRLEEHGRGIELRLGTRQLAPIEGNDGEPAGRLGLAAAVAERARHLARLRQEWGRVGIAFEAEECERLVHRAVDIGDARRRRRLASPGTPRPDQHDQDGQQRPGVTMQGRHARPQVRVTSECQRPSRSTKRVAPPIRRCASTG